MVKKRINSECEVLIVPSETIYESENVVYLEFIVGEGVDCTDNAQITTVPSLFKCKLDDDGLFVYYRFKLNTKTGLKGNIERKLYYDEVTSALMVGNTKIETSSQLEAILEYNETEYSILEVISEPVFSICRLNHCLSEFQRKFVLNGCNQACKNDSDKPIREFLFSTVFVLRQLIVQKRFGEALNILRTVEGCHTLCKDTKSVSKKCNCCK